MIDMQLIKRAFGDAIFQRGKKYWREGRVKKVQEKSKTSFQAHVKGSGRNMYMQEVVIPPNGRIDHYCTCPMGGECKHVVAAFFEINRNLAQRSIVHDIENNSFSTELSQWLEDVAQPPKTTSQKKEVIYLFSKKYNNIYVAPYAVRCLKSGKRFEDKPLHLSGAYNGSKAPKYFTLEDVAIFQILQSEDRYTTGSQVKLCAAIGYRLINDIVKTGRSFWEKYQEDQPLALSDAEMTGHFEWDISALNGDQTLKLAVQDKGYVLSKTVPPMAFSQEKKDVAIVAMDMSPYFIQKIQNMPAVKPKEAKAFQKQLNEKLEHSELRLPELRNIKFETRKIRPHAHIIFRSTFCKIGFIKRQIPVFEIQFQYGDHIFYPEFERRKTEDKITYKEGDTLIETPRDIAFEQNFISLIKEQDVNDVFGDFRQDIVLFTSDHHNPEFHHHRLYGYDGASNDIVKPFWIPFLYNVKKIFKDDPNHEVIVADDFPFGDVHEVHDWEVSFEESPYSEGLAHNIDWFDMNVYVELDGEKLPLLQELIQLLEQSSFKDLEKLPDDSPISFDYKGQCITTYFGKIRPILNAIKDLHHLKQNNFTEDGAIRFNPNEAMVLEEMRKANEAASLRIYSGERLEKLSQKMQSFSGIDRIEVPKILNATLRPYQYEGLIWLNFLREYSLSGILADDMGLGKTVQSLAWIAYEKEQGRLNKPVFVVAPTSLMYNWQKEAQTFTPDLKVLLLHGADRKERFEKIEEADIILTTYPLLARDKEVLLTHDYYAIILDEAQNIKNPRAKSTQILHQIKASHRFCLTGTPMENHLGELWSLFHFLQPGLLPSSKEFNQFYRKEIEKNDNSERQNALMRRIKPFMLRRTKEKVATELPPKTEFVRKAEFGKKQAKLYEAVRISMNKKVQDIIAKQGIAKSQIIILDALLKMRQVCCHPQLLKIEDAQKVEEAAKLDLLMEMLPEMIAEGRKILLFSSFTSMLSKISDTLDQHGIRHVSLTGRTKKREEVIKKFQTKDIPVFLISLKAGGVGLNLTEADTVIHYDPWWNPAAERQATDRAYRIGQDKPVFIYKLIMANSIEEKILELQEKKQKIADGIFDPNQAKESLQITQSDIQYIFNIS